MAVLALVVLAAATAFALPRVPTLDGERWFKLWLTTRLRGLVEREGGDAEAWAGAVVRYVPWHPAGRLPERKITAPERPPPMPALDGELALLEALQQVEGREARWARLYDEDEEGLVERLVDPATLGTDYDPSTWLGAEAAWDAIADQRPEELAEVLRRGTDARWVFVGERVDPALPDVDEVLLELLGPLGTRWDPEAAVEPHPQADALRRDIAARRDADETERALHLLATLHQLAPDHGDHVVLVGVGTGIQVVLEAERASAVLRDQTQAVLSLGGVIHGLDARDDGLAWERVQTWLQAHFRHDILDLEAAHRTPYLALQWLDRAADPPGVAGLPLDRARFPEPPMKGVRREALQVVDLGPLPADPELPTTDVALALWGTVLGWIRAHGD